MNRLQKHLSPATVISCIALFVALSGAAYAVKATIGNKAVKTRNLGNGAVTTIKLHGASVTTTKLVNGAVTGPKIGPGAVGSGQLADGAVRSAALGGGVVTTGKLKDGAVATDKIQDGAVSGAKLAQSLLAQLVKNVSYVSKASLSNSTEEAKSVTADCPAGKQVVGGGARIVGSATKVAITESAPVVSGDKRPSWSAAARAIAAEGSPWAVEAHAICAEF